MKRTRYRCEAVSVDGFIQQLAVSYITNGYFFYVSGVVPDGKDPRLTDQKIIDKYGINISKWTRSRRKQTGTASLQYIRFQQTFVILATHGKHRFIEEEREQLRDCKRVPIKLFGYSISYREGHVCVRLTVKEYNSLRGHLVELALHRTSDKVSQAFMTLSYQPYKPLRRQLLTIWRECNGVRKARGFDHLPIECIPMMREILKPFGAEVARRDAGREGDQQVASTESSKSSAIVEADR